MQARSAKPICAIANSLAASAAYWIGSAASDFYVTPGGEVAVSACGRRMRLFQGLEEDGVKVTLISAGKHKVEGNPYQPLDGRCTGLHAVPRQ